MVVSLLYLLFRRALAVAALRLRSREFKELEIGLLPVLMPAFESSSLAFEGGEVEERARATRSSFQLAVR